MFVELIESLRCPHDHEASPLIASAERTEARKITEGVLGCPVCGAEFPIREGVARFGKPEWESGPLAPSAEEAMRLAAFLGLTDGRGFAILSGSWAAHAGELAKICETPLVLVNPPPVSAADFDAAILVADSLPFAESAARAAAIDPRAPAALVASMVRCVRGGGRLVGAAGQPLPAGSRELVRDERSWVAEKESQAAAGLVALERARPPRG